MNLCGKYNILCPFCLEKCITDCIGTEGECEKYRTDPIELDKRFCIDLPCPVENWIIVYQYIISLPIDISKIKNVIIMDCKGNRLWYNFLFVTFKALCEIISKEIREEKFEKIGEAKRVIIDLYKECKIYAKQERDNNG